VGHTKDQNEWEKSDGRSAFGIQRVVFHDGGPPLAPSPYPAALWNAELHSWAEFTAHFAKTARTALDAWDAGRVTDEDERLLQAMLEGGLLSNRIEDESNVAALAAKFREHENAIPGATRAPGVCDDGYGC